MSGTRHTVLVTGATGFVGRRLVAHFTGQGHAVVAGSRSAPREDATFPAGVRTVALDITDPDTIPGALEGVDIVVHTAAKVGDWGSAEEFDLVLRQGTENLLAACGGHRLHRFVHLSSTLFYGITGRGTMTEGMLPGDSHMPYGDAKIAAEHAVKQARERLRLPTVILRPANIYGPGSPLWTDRPAELLLRGLLTLPLDHGRANVVFVDNVVAAVDAVCRHEAAVGETFNVVDDDQLTWQDFFNTYATGLGQKPVALRAPWLLYGLASTMEAVATVTGRAPLLTRSAVTYLRFGGTYAGDKLSRRLGYRPAMETPHALQHTVDYLRKRYDTNRHARRS